MILSLLLTFVFAQEIELNTIQGIRPEILDTSDDYLNARVNKKHYYKALQTWNQLGWSNEEKDIVVDTLQKSFDNSDLRDQWLCNLKPNLYCSTKTYFSMIKWPEYLEKFDTLIFAGQAYPKHQWNSLIINGQNRFIFISNRYAPLEFYGEPHSFKFPDQLQDLTFDQKKVDSPSFYQKHKKKIWWTIGGVLIATGLFSLAGKKIVFTQVGF